MFFGYKYRHSNNNPIKGIGKTLYDTLVKTSKLEQEDQFTDVLRFVRDQASNAWYDVSPTAYSEMLYTVLKSYPEVDKKYRDIILEQMLSSLSDKLKFYNKAVMFERYAKIGKTEKGIFINQITYWAVIHFLKFIIDLKEFDKFNQVFEELRNVNSEGRLNEMLGSFRSREAQNEEIGQRNLFYQRSLYFIIYSWILFLYEHGKLSKEELDKFELNKNFDPGFRLYGRPADMYNFFPKMRNEISHNLFEVEDWEIDKRKLRTGTYAVLSSETWLDFGFSMVLFKYDFFKNPPVKDIEYFEGYKFIIENIQKHIVETEKGILNKRNEWLKFLYPTISDDKIMSKFSTNKGQITSVLAEINKKAIIIEYESSVDLPLDNNRVNVFKQGVYLKWERIGIVPILKELNAINIIPDNDLVLGLGYNQNIIGLKPIFTENHPSIVETLTSIGSQLATKITDSFFNELVKVKGQISTKNLEKDLNAFIEAQDNKDSIVIITNWFGLGKLETLSSKENVVSHNQTYDEIPILTGVYNDLLVINMREAIEFNSCSNEKWVENELVVEVNELTEDRVEEIFKKGDAKWKYIDGIPLDEEQTKMYIRNALNIIVAYKYEMKVLDKNAYQIFKL